MELRTLRYFLTVAETGSLTNAANRLHLTQPTLSRQLKELEEELKVKLFARHSHGISLTQDGKRLRKRAEEILELSEKTCSEFSQGEAAINGDIYIGAGETRAIYPITEIIGDIRKEHPAVRFHFYNGIAQDVSERLDKGLLDFGIFIQPADILKYEHLNLPIQDIWGVITSKTGPLAAKNEITKSDLLGEPLLLPRQVISLTDSQNAFLDWFGKMFRQMNIMGTFNLAFNAAFLARQGIAHIVGIDGPIDVSESSSLCFRPLSPRLETRLDLVWKKHQVFSPAANVFLQKAQERFKTLS